MTTSVYARGDNDDIAEANLTNTTGTSQGRPLNVHFRVAKPMTTTCICHRQPLLVYARGDNGHISAANLMT